MSGWGFDLSESSDEVEPLMRSSTFAIFDAEVIARQSSQSRIAAMLAPPRALDAFGAFGGDHVVKRTPPFEA